MRAYDAHVRNTAGHYLIPTRNTYNVEWCGRLVGIMHVL